MTGTSRQPPWMPKANDVPAVPRMIGGPTPASIHYALKANSTLAVIRHLRALGVRADGVVGGLGAPVGVRSRVAAATAGERQCGGQTEGSNLAHTTQGSS